MHVRRPKGDMTSEDGRLSASQLALPLSGIARRFGGPVDLATAARQKELGAFYTPPAMAEVLTEWAVRSPTDRVLDPSFGGLVFLAGAHKRLRELGAHEATLPDQLFGVDLDEDAHAAAQEAPDLGLRSEHLLDRDFFTVEPSELPLFQAVVGNPPYIRYQGFKGSAVRARELAAAAGVKLTRLASSWATFVVHATSFVAPGGRLAQVLPAELLHAQYAGEVVEFLRRAFGQISIAVFEERVFPGALEDVVLLFADDRGASSLADVRLVPCNTVIDVRAGLASSSIAKQGNRPLGRGKLLAQLLPSETQVLYEHLVADERVSVLGDFASVDIGIVTGANDFFVLSQESAASFDQELLKPAVCKAAQIAGARLSPEDHHDLVRSGQRSLMLVADASTSKEALESIQIHLGRGRRAGLHGRYKCRIRDPWWALPIPKRGPPDVLLTYCSNVHPRLAVNEARVLNTNTIHGLRLSDDIAADALTVGFYNSLTLLSAELVGRSYGGGVLKLEPTEAEALLMPPPAPGLSDVLAEVDGLVRRRQLAAVLDLVDGLVLRRGLGLNGDEILRLRSGAEQLSRRRRARGKPPR